MSKEIRITKRRCKEIFLLWYEEARGAHEIEDSPEDAEAYAHACSEFFFETALSLRGNNANLQPQENTL